MERLTHPPRYDSGFSLTEVVIALGICTFVIISMLGLFQTGLVSGRESEDEIQAANLATRIIALRASTTNAIGGNEGTNTPIPLSMLTASYTSNPNTTNLPFVGLDGLLTSKVPANGYRICTWAGITPATGPQIAQIRVLLTWPASAAATNARGRYDAIYFMPLY